MARQPEVFVRGSGTGRGAATGQDHTDGPGSGTAAPGRDRAGLGTQGRSAAEAAAMFAASLQYARE